MAKTPEERRKILIREARQLAEAQGANWKELPKEQRREFKQQVRQTRAAQRENRPKAQAGKG